jgi:hypothetical protein
MSEEHTASVFSSDVRTQNTDIDVFTAVRTSNLIVALIRWRLSDVSLSQHVQNGFAAYVASYPTRTGDLLTGVKAAGVHT